MFNNKRIRELEIKIDRLWEQLAYYDPEACNLFERKTLGAEETVARFNELYAHLGVERKKHGSRLEKTSE